MLTLIGAFQVIAGLVAIIDDNFYLVTHSSNHRASRAPRRERPLELLLADKRGPLRGLRDARGLEQPALRLAQDDHDLRRPLGQPPPPAAA